MISFKMGGQSELLKSKSDYITFLLKMLQWLPTEFGIKPNQTTLPEMGSPAQPALHFN